MTATETKWAMRVSGWRESGKTVVAYAEGQPFKASTLKWWAYRLGATATASRRQEGVRAPRVAMAKVARGGLSRVASESGTSSLILILGHARIEVSRGFDAELLRALMMCVGGAS